MNSVFLQTIYGRLARGDHSARDELLVAVQSRMEILARKMLGDFPRVRRWEQTGDILQQASLRLLRALESVRPESERALYGLVAEQIRRVLIDLARHYQGPEGLGANHHSVAVAPHRADGSRPDLIGEAPDRVNLEELERWTALHRAIAQLPEDEREVLSLTYYQGWTQVQIAEAIGISDRTVRRIWQSACLKLYETMEGELPQLG